MPEGEPTVQNQLIIKINEAVANLMNAKDACGREVFSRDLFDACISDAETKLGELDAIQ